jgi:serpin B
MIRVDEAGTEAAAGSAVVMNRNGCPQSEVTMTINQPFLFLIRDNMSDAVFLLENLMEPGR